MNCEICNKTFNLTNRLPLMLPCCGDTACKECIINLAGEPQQKGFTCPAKDCGEPNQDQSTLKPNKKLERLLKQQLGIICDTHAQSQADFYCHNHKVIVCTACAITAHQGHQCQQLDKQLLTNYNDKILGFLRIELDRIERIINELESFQQNEKQFTSPDYLNLIKESKAILIQRLNQQELNEIEFPPKQHQNQQQQQDGKEEEKKEEEKKEEKPPQQQQQAINSKLIKQDDYELLKQYFNTDQLQLELIYRGTDHGFTAKAFHERCDQKGPTLTVAQSEHNQIFGGYTSVSWDSEIQLSIDAQAFMFQLTKKFKLNQFQNYQYAVYSFPTFGPWFGLNDLTIGVNKDFDQNSSCLSSIYDNDGNIQSTYSLPQEIQNNKEEANKYIAGSDYFNLKEIEIFRVIMN